MDTLHITKRDGSREVYRAELINRAIERACLGLEALPEKVMKVISDFELTLYDGITTREIDKSLVIAASQNIKEDLDYDTIAKNLLLLTIYKDCIDGYDYHENVDDRHKGYFKRYIKRGVEESILDPRMVDLFDLDRLGDEIDTERDRLFKFLGLTTLYDRYLIRDAKQNLMETPQAFWMRVCMGLSLEEAEPTERALDFYHHISKLEYVPATPTLFNSGTLHPQLSSCYIMNMYDEIEHIGKTVTDTMLLSKFAGGIGVNVTNVRAIGSHIKTINGKSSGVIPFLKILDVTIKGITQGGKRRGSICFYMENWHYEFDEFLTLRENSGDPYRRTYAANTAVWVSDEFMRRVEADEEWYLFDPAEVSDLPELYGEEFSKRYQHYEREAEAGRIKLFKKIGAREQYKEILMKLQTTSHPWLTFKDAMNVRALTKNAGVIHSSNLCTEIALPNDRENIAVCNLASINLSRFLFDSQPQEISTGSFVQAGERLATAQFIDYEKLEKAVRLAVRGLDNVIDINFYPVSETKHSNSLNRPVGLGLMGFTETIESLKMPYDSSEAANLIDEVMEFISYIAIDESCNLAQERGAYQNFTDSGWSKGQVPYDTLAVLERERGVQLEVSRQTKRDWARLRRRVREGVRNSTLMAIAPNATIGLISGTTPGIDPNFSNIFSRNTLSGKFLEFNPQLEKDLKKLDMWEEVKEDIIAHRGDITLIEDIPFDMKELYKTSFQVNPEAYTTIASRAQKWVDQAISRNMYLETRDVSRMQMIYASGWRKGLKSTYYLHMKQRHAAEQSTTKVNKRAMRKGFMGFGGVNKKIASPVAAALESSSDSLKMGSVQQTASRQSQPKAWQEWGQFQSSDKTGGVQPKRLVGFGAKVSEAKVGQVDLLASQGRDSAVSSSTYTSTMRVSSSMRVDPSSLGNYEDEPKRPEQLDEFVQKAEMKQSKVVVGQSQGLESVLGSMGQKQQDSGSGVQVQSKNNQSESVSAATVNTQGRRAALEACPVDPMERLQCESCQ